jgi:predicted kinase
MSQPTLYLMLGYPGAGKTTVAGIISEVTGAVHLSSDELRQKMFDKPEFTEAEHSKLYAELDRQTEELLGEGKSVIYDANLNRYQHRQEKYDICERTGARPVLIWLKTPRELAKERAKHLSRQHLWPSNETPDAMFERIAGIIEPPTADEKPTELDGTNATSETIKQSLSQLHLL